MATKQKQRKCPVCGRRTLHQKEVFDDGWGCLLTILTGGLFFLVWIVIGIVELFKPYRCQVCGKADW